MSKSRIPVLAVSLALAALPGVALAQVKVENAWVRGTVANQPATGAFLDIVSDRDRTLVGASSPVAGTVELHRSETKNNVMVMRPVERIALPAGKRVRLAPGGYHVMLLELKGTLADGDKVPIVLTFEDAAKQRENVEISAVVRGLGAAPAHKH